MTYPPPVNAIELKILGIIARGHPDRTMNFRTSFGSPWPVGHERLLSNSYIPYSIFFIAQ